MIATPRLRSVAPLAPVLHEQRVTLTLLSLDLLTG